MEDLPAGLDTPRSDFPGMAVQLRDDTGRAGPAGQRYVLRYEAMPVPVSSAPRPEAGPLEVHLITP